MTCRPTVDGQLIASAGCHLVTLPTGWNRDRRRARSTSSAPRPHRRRVPSTRTVRHANVAGPPPRISPHRGALVSYLMGDQPAVRATTTGIPSGWRALWTLPARTVGDSRTAMRRLQELSQAVAETVPIVDRSSSLGSMVGSVGMRDEPVHRWFGYKEGFSPNLLGEVITTLDLGESLKVVDAFGGVGTTALSGLVHPRVSEVRSVEYSPLAHFVGSTKVKWPSIDGDTLNAVLPAALDYKRPREVELPSLSSFSNRDIIGRQRLRALVAARDHVRSLGVAQPIRDVLLLGIAAVLEDLSGAMKDGRALRIKHGRRRRPSSLASTPTRLDARGVVKRALAGQWTAMAEDIATLQAQHSVGERRTQFLRGDARELDKILVKRTPAFPKGWADLAVFSPPYLNCLDYTELYKLELWFLEFVTTQEEFREVRLGTLRSHPSVRFPPRSYLNGLADPAIDLVSELSAFATSHTRRNDVGPVIQSYFEDMFRVWVQQHRVLRPGGIAACVVANSTLSRRERAEDGSFVESWRMPVLTDVLLARLALLAGFDEVVLLSARHLRPRNAGAASARESVVIASRCPGLVADLRATS